jgi:hypothetical protein
VFVLPGFVTLLLRERSFTVKGEDSAFERLLNALFYSALIYSCVLVAGALLGVDKADLVAFYHGEKTLWEDLGAGVVIALVLPMLITELGLLWQSSEDLRPSVLKRLGIDPGHQVQSGWNQMFGRRGTAFLRVTLKDDRVVGSYYGDGSLAGYSAHTQDLFIVERWELDDDGWFTQKRRAPRCLDPARQPRVRRGVRGSS